jgi:acyl-CoA thioester hydrolase
MNMPQKAVRPKDRRREEYLVHVEVPTRWADHDTYGHVNNAVHVVMLDSALNGWLITASGVDIRTLQARGVVVHTELDYVRELKFPEIATVGIGVSRRGRSSITYDIALFTEGHAEPAATASFVHVYVDREAFTPVPIPAEIEAALRCLGPDPAPVGGAQVRTPHRRLPKTRSPHVRGTAAQADHDAPGAGTEDRAPDPAHDPGGDRRRS